MAKWQIIIDIEGDKPPSKKLMDRAKRAAENIVRVELMGFNQFIENTQVIQEGDVANERL